MKFFQILANKKSILILFLIFIGFNIYFTLQFQDLNKLANQEVKILDLRFGYSLDEVKLFFEQIGNDGRLLYAKISKADMFYPISYGLFIMSLISFFAKGNSKIYLLNLLPVAAVLIDFVENNAIMKLMANFPDLESQKVSNCSFLTQTKWVFVGLSIVAVVFLLVKSVYLKRR